MKPIEREWSQGEEIANSLSHFAGFFAALLGTPFLISRAVHHGGAGPVIGMCVFAVTTVLLYFTSATHHWLRAGRAKDVFEVLDHASIFLLIAGTYTPFAVGVLWGPWGWALLIMIWPLSLFGVLFRFRRGLESPRFTVSLYVVMGALIFIAIRPIWARIPTPGLLLLFGGGAAYLGGLLFYFARRLRFHHLAWHLCVLAGTALQYFAVLKYAL